MTNKTRDVEPHGKSEFSAHILEQNVISLWNIDDRLWTTEEK